MAEAKLLTLWLGCSPPPSLLAAAERLPGFPHLPGQPRGRPKRTGDQSGHRKVAREVDASARVQFLCRETAAAPACHPPLTPLAWPHLTVLATSALPIRCERPSKQVQRASDICLAAPPPMAKAVLKSADITTSPFPHHNRPQPNLIRSPPSPRPFTRLSCARPLARRLAGPCFLVASSALRRGRLPALGPGGERRTPPSSLFSPCACAPPRKPVTSTRIFATLDRQRTDDTQSPRSLRLCPHCALVRNVPSPLLHRSFPLVPDSLVCRVLARRATRALHTHTCTCTCDSKPMHEVRVAPPRRAERACPDAHLQSGCP